jgi:hypothetical protein
MPMAAEGLPRMPRHRCGAVFQSFNFGRARCAAANSLQTPPSCGWERLARGSPNPLHAVVACMTVALHLTSSSGMPARTRKRRCKSLWKSRCDRQNLVWHCHWHRPEAAHEPRPCSKHHVQWTRPISQSWLSTHRYPCMALVIVRRARAWRHVASDSHSVVNILILLPGQPLLHEERRTRSLNTTCCNGWFRSISWRSAPDDVERRARWVHARSCRFHGTLSGSPI